MTCGCVSIPRLISALIVQIVLFCSGAPFVRAQTVRINWSDLSRGYTTQRLFGSNDQQCGYGPTGANDASYAANMTSLNIKFLRLHSDIVDQWTTSGAWDQSKISSELNAPYVKRCGGGNIMITINYVPSWCRDGGSPTGAINASEYAAFCAQLVEIVNKKLGKHVLYWECMNEPDHWSEFDNHQTDMFNLYNACARAMKGADKSIKLGGPDVSWYNAGLVDQFLTACWPNISFLSWHHYMACESGTDIYGIVMTNTDKLAGEVNTAHEAVSRHRANGFTDGHLIECALDEFNIPCDWQNIGWEQDQNAGAVFFASVLRSLALANLDIGASWSAKDRVYGLIDMNDAVRPAGYVYGWLNNELVGAIASNDSDNGDCQVLPIYRGRKAAGDKHAMLLINKYSGPHNITLLHGLPIGQSAHVTLIDAAGLHPTSIRLINTQNPVFAMPGFSVALITMP